MKVELQDIKFTYPDGDKVILSDITETVESGQRVIICGENGSGKSTLLQIIAGLYDVTQGQVIYNGLPKGNLNLTSLRSSIGDCSAHEQLFDGTVLENIAVGRPGATFENVRWAVQKLNLDRFINELPNGYDTHIDPQGKKLSKSVIQKLLLARSIADRPKLLLLEDALEHLDDTERRGVVDFLVSEDNDWTIIAATADNYFRSKADKVIEMKDGCFTHLSNKN